MISAVDSMILEAAVLHEASPNEFEVPAVTLLMSRCGDLLACMHQPDETAEESLLSMLDELEDCELADSTDGRQLGYPTHRVAPILSELEPVGVLEKVAWMHDKEEWSSPHDDPPSSALVSSRTGDGLSLDTPRASMSSTVGATGTDGYGTTHLSHSVFPDRPFFHSNSLGDSQVPGAMSLLSVEGSYPLLLHTRTALISEPATTRPHSPVGSHAQGPYSSIVDQCYFSADTSDSSRRYL